MYPDLSGYDYDYEPDDLEPGDFEADFSGMDIGEYLYEQEALEEQREQDDYIMLQQEKYLDAYD